MNTLMIPTEWLSKKLKLQTVNSSKWLSSGKFAWFALVGSVAIMLLAQKLLHKNIPILLIWLVVSVLITLRYKPAVFHIVNKYVRKMPFTTQNRYNRFVL
jgi:cobalamin biosynthesis protein CobD/CbiB